jgi:hypothetical protein
VIHSGHVRRCIAFLWVLVTELDPKALQAPMVKALQRITRQGRPTSIATAKAPTRGPERVHPSSGKTTRGRKPGWLTRFLPPDHLLRELSFYSSRATRHQRSFFFSLAGDPFSFIYAQTRSRSPLSRHKAWTFAWRISLEQHREYLHLVRRRALTSSRAW